MPSDDETGKHGVGRIGCGLAILVLFAGSLVWALWIKGTAPPIVSAARSGDISKVRDVIQSGADIDARDSIRRTALHWAAYQGRTDIATLLLDKSADVNAQDHEAWTPLHMAAHKKDLEMTKLLLAREANPNMKDNYGNTPRDLIKWGLPNDVDTLLKKYGGNRQQEP